MCSVSRPRACSCRVYRPVFLRARKVGCESCTRETLYVLSGAELWFVEKVGLDPKHRGTLAEVEGMDPPPWEQR